jgi:hypothetical protein
MLKVVSERDQETCSRSYCDDCILAEYLEEAKDRPLDSQEKT